MSEATQILRNANVCVMDPENTHAEAIAWRDGRILSIGTLAEVSHAAGAAAQQWDARGATVLPGFIDPHHHTGIAALYGARLCLSAPAVTDIPSLQRALSAAAAALPPGSGQWLVATDWDELKLAERRPPTRQELDEAVPDRPLMAMHWTCHRALANSRALELAGIGRHTASPAGGIISRGASGLPDGLLLERAMSRVETLARASQVAHDAERFFAQLAAHHRAVLAVGITGVADAAVPPDLMTLYHAAAQRGALRVPTVMMPVSIGGWTEEPRDVLCGPVTGQGDELLSIGPLKLVFDGAPACALCLGWWQLASATVATMALAVRQGSLDPLRAAAATRPQLGRKLRSGISIYRREEARDMVRSAADSGFALAIHAIGNDAIDNALQACEGAGSALDRAGVPRIEHFLCADRALIARAAAVGAAAVIQPCMLDLPFIGHTPAIPGLPVMPARWLLDAGVKVVGSSDFPCASFDPLDAIRRAVTRRLASGRVHEPEQRLTLQEALVMYTRSAAEVCGRSDRCGTLTPSKRADLVVLDGPLTRAEQLDSARVRATVLGGEVVSGELQAAKELQP